MNLSLELMVVIYFGVEVAVGIVRRIQARRMPRLLRDTWEGRE